MGSEKIYGSKEIWDKVLKDNNTTNKNFKTNNINNWCPDVNFKNEADFDRRKSLKEDFLFYDVTVEGTTQDMFVKYLTLF